MSRPWFPKVGQVASLGAMSSKGVRGGAWGHNLGVFKGSLETYTRYSRIADEEQLKKKRVSDVFEYSC